MSDTETTEPKRRQVFVSYARADKDIARKVATALRDAGLLVWIDAWELAVGDSIGPRIDQAIASSDVLLVLLSKSAVASKWVQKELSAALSGELRDRAITVVPALIEDCDIPPLLADRLFLDLREDLPTAIQRLVEQIGTVPTLDFSTLDVSAFEGMVSDLLVSLGFSVQQTLLPRDSGYDLVALYRSRDPFGAEQIDRWLVVVKLYRDARASIQVLQHLLGILAMTGGSNKGLVVTTGRLTSVARAFLAQSVDKSRHELRVIDRTELTNLLIQHPEVTRKYFHTGRSHE